VYSPRPDGSRGEPRAVWPRALASSFLEFLAEVIYFSEVEAG